MLTKKVKNFISGYKSFEIEGLSHEKIINSSVNKNLKLWDLKRIDYARVEGYTRIRDYDKLSSIVEGSGCSIKSKRTKGFPLLLKKIRNNKGIGIGFIIALMIVYLFSIAIWKIDIEGTSIVDNKDVIEFLNSEGVGKGTIKSNIDKFKLRQDLLVEFEDFIWIGMDINGSSLVVRVKEREPDFKTVDKSKPTNIVARKYGVIERVIAKSGDSLVEKGDIVKKDQVLISGLIKREGLPSRMVTSIGTVQARTFYVKDYETSRFEIKKNMTGRKIKSRTIKFFGFTLNINDDKCNFKDYIVDTNNKDITLWRKFKVPIEIITDTYYEVVLQKKKIPEDLLKQSMKNYLNVNLYSNIPEGVTILDKKYEFSNKGDKINCELIIEALEYIGESKNINLIKED